MTQQYQQEAINDFGNPSSLEIQSFDFRQAEALVPPGTTASYQRVRIPGILALSRLSWSGVLAPGVGETIEPADSAAEAWKARIMEWKGRIERDPAGETAVRDEAAASGIRPVPIRDQLVLQWRFICAGIEQITG